MSKGRESRFENLRRWTVMALPGILGLGLVITILVVRSSAGEPESTRRPARVVESPEIEAERARKVGEFQKSNVEAINRKLDERIKADVTFAGSLESLDEGFIDSLDSFSEAEKQEMRELIRSAKERARVVREGKSASPKSNR